MSAADAPVVLRGEVMSTYLGRSPASHTRQSDVTVMVQVRQARPAAPWVKAVIWCGGGDEAAFSWADTVRTALRRHSTVAVYGDAITYCADHNCLTVRGLLGVAVQQPDGAEHWVQSRPSAETRVAA